MYKHDKQTNVDLAFIKFHLKYSKPDTGHCYILLEIFKTRDRPFLHLT